jgi:translocation and assembly module TamB
MTAAYADRRLTGRLQLFRNGDPVLAVTGAAPIDLSFVDVERRLPDDSLVARITADSVDLAIIEAMAPAFVQRVRGVLSTDVGIGGTWRLPTVSGRLAVSGGEMSLPQLGIRLRDVNADIGLGRDSIRVRRLEAMSGERNGHLSVTGGIALPTESLGDYKHIAVDLRMLASRFQAVRQRRLADLEVSGDLRLAGPFTAARLAGALEVERGALYIQDAPQKQLVALDDPEFASLIDTTDLESRRLIDAPTVVDTLIRYLDVENVDITLGDDVWLRSEETNVKLSGAIEVTKSDDRLALAGELRADRGTYTLDLGIVQRRFDVTQGSISFYGVPGFNPGLDISAVHTVRQVDRPDVRIRATIGGTLLQPRLTLTSDERIPLSTTNILSYLVFGVPEFALPQGQSALRPVAQALLPTAGVVLERTLMNLTGGFVDNISIQAGGLGAQGNLSGQTFSEALYSTRIGVGKQIGERTFVTANAGLCAVSRQTTGSQASFAQTLGITVEVRLNNGFSIQTGVEPAASALLCNRPGAIVQTPQQLGFDLFREWSF